MLLLLVLKGKHHTIWKIQHADKILSFNIALIGLQAIILHQVNRISCKNTFLLNSPFLLGNQLTIDWTVKGGKFWMSLYAVVESLL